MTSRRGLFALGLFASLLVGSGGTEEAEARERRSIRKSAPPVSHRRVRTAPSLTRPRRATPKPLIVIDPGHGGHDPGAVGVQGSLEKTIVLAVAQELRRALLATGRYRVALTRDSDTFLTLRARLDFTRRSHAALLISLHADSAPGARGASAYTLRGAVPGSAGPMNASVRLARLAVAEVGRVTPLLDNPHREAGFAVLRASNIPSILVELGFLSNRHDEVSLGRAGHRRGLARALARAVDNWFVGDGPLVIPSDATG